MQAASHSYHEISQVLQCTVEIKSSSFACSAMADSQFIKASGTH